MRKLLDAVWFTGCVALVAPAVMFASGVPATHHNPGIAMGVVVGGGVAILTSLILSDFVPDEQKGVIPSQKPATHF